MSFVKTIRGNYPSPREDGVAFITARIDEGPSETGPWDLDIQSFALVPEDPDPAHPLGRAFTITTSTLEDSWLRVVWIDAASNIDINDPIYSRALPPTIATVADVRRAMRLAPNQVVSDDDIAWALQVVVSYLGPKLPDYIASDGVEQYFDVRADDILHLPVPGSSVTSVVTYYGNQLSQTMVAGTDYYVAEDRVRLYGKGTAWDPRYEPGNPSNTVWQRVEVAWSSEADPPAAVREGVALAAAGLYILNPTLIKGMRSERIGSYSYTLSDKDVESAIPLRAYKLMKPFMKKRHVFVT